MLKRLFITFISVFFIATIGMSQLPHGSSAPNFTVQDINSGSFSLYAHTGSGRGAVLDFFATWCGPCWSFHNSGTLNRVVNELGAISAVIALEADTRTNTGCILNSGCNYSTLGNWATVPYQIANLTTSNGGSVASQYQLAYYPTLYVISHDNRAYELRNKSYNIIRSWLQESFFLDANPIVGNADCGGDGFIDLNRVSGYGAISYSWSNGSTSEDLNNIGAGTYSVTVEDQNGYDRVFGPFIVTGPSEPLSVEVDYKEDVDCFGTSTGLAQVSGFGGNGGYQYNWSNGQSGPTARNLRAGLYKVSIVDSRGCTDEETIIISEPSLMTASGNEVDETCNRSDGRIYINARGGVPPYTYDIGDGPTLNSTFTDLSAGSYTVEVIDRNDCLVFYEATVGHVSGPDALAGADLQMDCSVDTLVVAGSGSSGSSINYLWTTADGQIIGDSTTLEIEIAAPGTYILSVIDANTSCVTYDTMLVEDHRTFPVNEFESFEILTCLEPEQLLSVKPDSHVVYAWYTSDGNILSRMDSTTVEVDQEGYYFVEARDTFSSCSIIDSVYLEADQSSPSFGVSGPAVHGCPDEELRLNIIDLDTSRSYQYSWQTNDGLVIDGEEELEVIVGAPGTYTVTVIDIQNGCSTTREMNIEKDWNEAASEFTYAPDILKVSFMDLSGGEGLTWYWEFGDDKTSQEQNPVHTYEEEGTFEVCLTVTNECGDDQLCKEIEVSEQRGPLEVTSAEITHVTCFGGTDGSITLNVLGGYPPYDILWSNGAQGPQVLDLPSAVYSVEIKDDKDNVITTDYTVLQPDQIEEDRVTILHSGPSGNGSIELLLKGGVPDYDFSWSNGAVTNPAINLTPGEYWCEVIDENDCVETFGPYVVEMTTSVFDTKVKSITVYPNPGFNNICLDAQVPSLVRIEFLAITGQVQDVEIDDRCIDVSNLLPGTYLLKAWSEDGDMHMGKWIKTQ